MKRITFRKLFASIAMILMAVLVMNAQSADIPWHVVVYENDQEVASHSIEVINDVQVSSEDVTFVLSDGQTFTYPIASTFKFEQRAGNGTAIETIAATQWNVYYDGYCLHFTESVNNVAVYSVSGILITKFSGNQKEIPISLTKGVYIVQASGKSAKLSIGGAFAQATTFKTAPQASYSPVFRAANADLKQYWNITATRSTTPIDISQVISFYFTPDNTIVFSLKNGNNVELANYTGMKFDIEPVQNNSSNWDLDLTMKYGGASYVMNGPPPSYYIDIYDICAVAIAKDYIVGEGILESIPYTKIMKRDIARSNFLTERLGIQYFEYGSYDVGYYLTQYYEMSFVGTLPRIEFNPYFETYFSSGGWGVLSLRIDVFGFNNGTPAIPTKIKLNADDSLTMSFTDVVSGTTYSHTFPAP